MSKAYGNLCCAFVAALGMTSSGCGDDPAATASDAGDQQPGDPSGDRDAAAGASDASTGSSSDAAVDPGPAPVRFIAVGDTGTGSADQQKVADAMAAKCAADGCDFVVLLGDNIYEAGVTSVDDGQWQEKFEIPYAALDVPFYAVLGNHDYGGKLIFDAPGVGNEFDKGPLEVQYTQVSDKWRMPATFYTMTHGNVGFIMLDTNAILWDNIDHGDQREWYHLALAELGDVDWIIGAGHHPYRSNGSHGNAGNYEALEIGGNEVPNPIPVLNGSNVKSFFDQHVCGTLDVYLSGHDHDREWLDEPAALCETELIVSGAGAKLRGLKNRGNQVFFQDDQELGFLYVVIDGDTFTGQFLDADGNVDFERSLAR